MTLGSGYYGPPTYLPAPPTYSSPPSYRHAGAHSGEPANAGVSPERAETSCNNEDAAANDTPSISTASGGATGDRGTGSVNSIQNPPKVSSNPFCGTTSYIGTGAPNREYGWVCHTITVAESCRCHFDICSWIYLRDLCTGLIGAISRRTCQLVQLLRLHSRGLSGGLRHILYDLFVGPTHAVLLFL